MEYYREKRGLEWDDISQDDEIIKSLQSGEKLSKSKHMVNNKNKKDED
jgi:hypothetical protein